jgi:putative ABC transport system permease protein
MIRSLIRTPGYFLTAVLSLGIALGAGAAAFSVIDAVRFRALPFKDGDRLVLLSEVPINQKTGATVGCRSICDVSYEVFDRVLARVPFRTLELVSGYTSGGKALNTGTEPILLTGGVASKNLFPLLGVAPMLGRGLTPEDDRLGVPLVTVLSYDLWVNQFGKNPAVIGQDVKLSDSHYTIVGVMPRGFNHEVGSQFWLPAVPTLDPSTRPSIKALTVIARLAPGRSIEQARAELAGLDPNAITTARTGPTEPTRIEVSRLRDRYASSTQAHDLIFAAIVACILLIAIANLSNLTLLRTLRLQREYAVRSALGASTGRLLRTIFSDHLIVVTVAAVLGLSLAAGSLRILQSLTALSFTRPAGMEYRLDLRVIGFTILLSLIVAVLLSLVPGWVVTHRGIQGTLRDGATAVTVGRGAGRAQRIFVVAQIASAIVLLTGAGLMTKTVGRLSRLDLGFDTEHVVQGTPSFPHPWRVKEKYLPVTRQIAEELGRLPGAAGVGILANVALGPRGSVPVVRLEGQATPLAATVVPTGGIAVSPGYFRTLGIRLLRGRGFTDQDLELTPRVAIVNQWAASRWWPGQDAIGKTISVDTASASAPLVLTVVGVSQDSKAAEQNLLLAEDGPEVFLPYEQASSPFPTFYLRTPGAPQPILKPVRELLARLVPDRPVSAVPVADQVGQQLSGVQSNTYQILSFAVVGFGLALIGLYGVLSYAVSRRVQELGIRGALGASRRELRGLVMADAARLALSGVVIGLPVAALATSLIQGMLYGTSRTDPLVYAAVAVLVFAVSLVASYLPARRAARVDPIVALRAL